MNKSEQRHISPPGANGVDGVVRKTDHSQVPWVHDGHLLWWNHMNHEWCPGINFTSAFIRFMDLSASFQKVRWICLERELSQQPEFSRLFADGSDTTTWSDGSKNWYAMTLQDRSSAVVKRRFIQQVYVRGCCNPPYFHSTLKRGTLLNISKPSQMDKDGLGVGGLWESLRCCTTRKCWASVVSVCFWSAQEVWQMQFVEATKGTSLQRLWRLCHEDGPPLPVTWRDCRIAQSQILKIYENMRYISIVYN